MSSSNSKILKLSENYPIFKKVFIYYNIYIRNLKFFFKRSQSQFGEDQKIAKLFHNNKNGMYLDVGCFHPIRQNNTYLLHKQGWNGMNIDLNPLSVDLFKVARPKDINICSAVSDKKSTQILYFDHSLSSLNTLSKKHLFFLKKAFGLNKFKKRKIKTNTLTNLLKKNNYKLKFKTFVNYIFVKNN